MKINHLSFTLLFSAILLTGCSQSNEWTDNNEDPEEGTISVPMTFSATSGNDGKSTRTSHEEDGNNGFTVTWAEGDKVSFYTSDFGTKYRESTVGNLSADKKSGTFNATLSWKQNTTKGKVSALYPGVKSTPSDQFVPITLTGTPDLSTEDYMWTVSAELTDLTANTATIPLRFKHLFTVLGLKVSNPVGKPITVSEVAIVGNEQTFASEVKLEIISGQTALTTRTSTMTQTKQATVIPSGGAHTFNMMVCVPSSLPKTWTIIVKTTDGDIYSMLKETPVDVRKMEPGHRYVFTVDKLQSTAWDGSNSIVNANAKYSGGDGSQATPYLLTTAADLAQMAANYPKINPAYSTTKYFRLEADINLADQAWIPVASFFGNLDGKHHTISGLNVNNASGNAGLFGGLAGATITNLHVAGTVTTGMTSGNNAGGMCGEILSGTNIISGCSFRGSVTGYVAGGIYGGHAASAPLSIMACRNEGAVTGNNAGGIASYPNQTQITACYNQGAITGTGNDSKTGGIVGTLRTGCAITACYNIGTIAGGATNKGTIYGESFGTITACYAEVNNMNNSGTTIFSTTTWPKTADNIAWSTATKAPGTLNQYWLYLGATGINVPTIYPKLWWE